MSFAAVGNINLQAQDLVEFVIQHSKGQAFEKLPFCPNDFTYADKREVRQTSASVYWTRYSDCAVYISRSQPKFLARQELKCLASKPAILAISAHLLLHSSMDASQRALISKAFTDFDASKNGDPSDYITEQLKNTTGITRQMFRIDFGYTVTISGDLSVDERIKNNFLEYWKANVRGSIIVDRNGKSESLGQYIERNDLWAKEIGVRDVPMVVPDVPDPDKIETDDPQKTAEDRAEYENKAGDCNSTKTETHEVADLLHWIEIKIVWSEGRIDLGCGNYMTYQYPEFRSREVAYVLYAAVTLPDPTDSDKRDAVLNCFWSSVLAATVVGIALANPKAALIAFKALFLACIVAKFEHALSCITVDTFIQVKVVQDWH